jgi:hypothetical protein
MLTTLTGSLGSVSKRASPRSATFVWRGTGAKLYLLFMELNPGF